MTMTCAFNKSFLAPCGRGVRRGGQGLSIIYPFIPPRNMLPPIPTHNCKQMLQIKHMLKFNLLKKLYIEERTKKIFK
jgi:hypothetical protein